MKLSKKAIELSRTQTVSHLAYAAISSHDPRIHCTRCSELLDPDKVIWLHLNCSTGDYMPLDQEVPEEDSQGCFPFGKACAQRILKEQSPPWEQASQKEPSRDITLTVQTVDYYRATRHFKTLKGARAFAQKWVGKHPDLGSTYAVGTYGDVTVAWLGCDPEELWPYDDDPAPVKPAPVEPAPIKVESPPAPKDDKDDLPF